MAERIGALGALFKTLGEQQTQRLKEKQEFERLFRMAERTGTVGAFMKLHRH